MNQRSLAVFGSVDGLTLFMGLILGLVVSQQTNNAAWHAALGGGMGELVGMSVGAWLSGSTTGGWTGAAACGVAGCLSCLLPGIPFAVLSSREAALVASLIAAAAVAAVISVLRPEHGLVAVTHTYAVLLLAGVLSGLTGLL